MMKKISTALVLVILCGLFLTGCAYNRNIKFTASGMKLNTFVSITIYGGNQSIADDALALCDHYENIFSRTKADSLLYSLNEIGSLRVNDADSKELAELIRTGMYYGELTDGALDISLLPVTGLWNFGNEEQALPSAEAISEALKNTGLEGIELTDSQIKLNGAGIDLGAIAKGYIADKIAEFLKTKNIENAIISLGGNILCIGTRPDGNNFKIGVARPFCEAEDIIARLSIKDMSVVTSGVYERYFYDNGKFYHHILNPQTGYPCDNGLLSVTIIAKDSVVCDCLSTGCFVLGPEKGMELINRLDEVDGIFVDSDYNVTYSDNAKKYLVDID